MEGIIFYKPVATVLSKAYITENQILIMPDFSPQRLLTMMITSRIFFFFSNFASKCCCDGMYFISIKKNIIFNLRLRIETGSIFFYYI